VTAKLLQSDLAVQINTHLQGAGRWQASGTTACPHSKIVASVKVRTPCARPAHTVPTAPHSLCQPAHSWSAPPAQGLLRDPAGIDLLSQPRGADEAALLVSAPHSLCQPGVGEREGLQRDGWLDCVAGSKDRAPLQRPRGGGGAGGFVQRDGEQREEIRQRDG
jgi:hypothetical protein